MIVGGRIFVLPRLMAVRVVPMNMNMGDRIFVLVLTQIVTVRRGQTDLHYHFRGACCTWAQDPLFGKYRAEEWDGLEYL